MAHRTANFHQCIVLIEKLPSQIWWSIDPDGDDGILNMQAGTQKELNSITRSLGGIWQKKYDEGCQWWNYDSEIDGVKIHIYAVRENPKTCKAIVETRQVAVEVPVEFETRMVTKDVIVGWDCGSEVDQSKGGK